MSINRARVPRFITSAFFAEPLTALQKDSQDVQVPSLMRAHHMSAQGPPVPSEGVTACPEWLLCLAGLQALLS